MRDRTETARQVLRDRAAEFVSRQADPHSLITVTRAEISSDFSHASLFISVLPADKETAALGLLNRHMTEFKEYLKKHARLPREPYIEFKLESLS